VQEHQAACQKLTWAEEVRTIMTQKSAFAVLSTISKKHGGFPMGSIAGFAVDAQGRPFFSFSTLSAHTQNLIADPRCSLCVTEANFKGAADARVTLMGNVARVEGAEEDELRKAYVQSHAGAYWAEFKDFSIYRMNDITDVSFVGGFARAGSITPQEYMGASPDPLQPFAEPVMSHMNADHTDALKDYVTFLVGVEGGVDRYSMAAYVYICAYVRTCIHKRSARVESKWIRKVSHACMCACMCDRMCEYLWCPRRGVEGYCMHAFMYTCTCILSPFACRGLVTSWISCMYVSMYACTHTYKRTFMDMLHVYLCMHVHTHTQTYLPG
jgi:putative heme iron utilization protein